MMFAQKIDSSNDYLGREYRNTYLCHQISKVLFFVILLLGILVKSIPLHITLLERLFLSTERLLITIGLVFVSATKVNSHV